MVKFVRPMGVGGGPGTAARVYGMVPSTVPMTALPLAVQSDSLTVRGEIYGGVFTF
jgi:hypothetical protein